MARDGNRRPFRCRNTKPSVGRHLEPTPVDQLEIWRNWRHDTAEFAPYSEPDYSGFADERTEVIGNPVPARRRRRPGLGLLVGLGLVAAALLLGGLAAAGVGPVRNLLGSNQTANRTPAGATSTGGSSANASTGKGDTGKGDTGSSGTGNTGTSATNEPPGPGPAGPAADGPAAKAPAEGPAAANHPGGKGPPAPPGGDLGATSQFLR